jgi:hypothetical protein
VTTGGFVAPSTPRPPPGRVQQPAREIDREVESGDPLTFSLPPNARRTCASYLMPPAFPMQVQAYIGPPPQCGTAYRFHSRAGRGGRATGRCSSGCSPRAGRWRGAAPASPRPTLAPTRQYPTAATPIPVKPGIATRSDVKASDRHSARSLTRAVASGRRYSVHRVLVASPAAGRGSARSDGGRREEGTYIVLDDELLPRGRPASVPTGLCSTRVRERHTRLLPRQKI